jgi:hypothetical protein
MPLLLKVTVPLNAIKGIISDDMQAVDQVIRQRLHSDVVLIRQISDYIINSGETSATNAGASRCRCIRLSRPNTTS